MAHFDPLDGIMWPIKPKTRPIGVPARLKRLLRIPKRGTRLDLRKNHAKPPGSLRANPPPY